MVIYIRKYYLYIHINAIAQAEITWFIHRVFHADHFNPCGWSNQFYLELYSNLLNSKLRF